MRKIPYLVGNTRIRDHTYWPSVLDEEIVFSGIDPDTRDAHISAQYPLTITPTQLQLLTWRIREWRLTGAATATRSDADGTNLYKLAWSLTTENDIHSRLYRANPSGNPDDPDVEITSEKHILTPNDYDPSMTPNIAFPLKLMGNGLRNHGGSFYTDDTDNYTATDYPAEIFKTVPDFPFFTTGEPMVNQDTANSGAFVGFLWLYQGMPTIWDPVSQTFRVQLNADFEFLATANTPVGHNFEIIALPATQAAISSLNPNYKIFDGALHFDFTDGDIVDVPMKVLVGVTPTVGGTTNTVTGSFDFTLTASKWWAFENAAGQPVYDTATGAQIHDLK